METVESRKFVDAFRMRQEELDCGVVCIDLSRLRRASDSVIGLEMAAFQ